MVQASGLGLSKLGQIFNKFGMATGEWIYDANIKGW